MKISNFKFLPLAIFKVSGHSMEPTLHAGQFVLVNRWAKPKVGDLVIVNDAQVNILIVKRILKEVRGWKWEVRGDNKGHGRTKVIDEAQIIGRVIGY